MNCFRWLLRGGYFPKELPPAFSTAKFSVAVVRALRSGATIPQSGQRTAEMALHSLARPGGLRRMLGVPCPPVFSILAKEVADNWKGLKRLTGHSSISESKPQLNAAGRSLAPKGLVAELPKTRLLKRTGGRFLLLADISEFYKSIYTHSIPWAIHTRAKAKANKTDMTLVGNRLDKAIRNCQDQQTNGIPTGPDTSFLLGEVILSSLDEQMFRGSPLIAGHRYYDDYELVFSRIGDAEEVLARMQSQLGVFGLNLNPTKTRIVELPQLLDDPVFSRIKHFDADKNGHLSDSAAFLLFDYLVEEKKKQPTANFFSYAIPALLRPKWTGSAWESIQALALQLAEAEPSALQTLIIELFSARNEGRTVTRALYEPFINRIIEKSAASDNGHEVVWAVWAAIQLDYKLTATAVSAIDQMMDPFVAIVSLHAEARNLTPTVFSRRNWKGAFDTAGLFGDQWILAYEAQVKGWSGSATNYVAADPYFQFLQTNDVSFYNERFRINSQSLRRFRSTQRSRYESLEIANDDDDDDDDDAEFF